MNKVSTASSQNNDAVFSRFLVFQGEFDENGKVHRTKNVGMAYLKEGHQTITMRLWTFVNERFYLILHKDDSSRYLVMTREPNKNPNSRNKYFWNIVGSGMIDSAQGIVQIAFDLFDRPVYMNVLPESSTAIAEAPESKVF